MTRDDYTRRDEPGCLFCEVPRRDTTVSQNELAYGLRDAFPVTPLHTLVIPKRHAVSYFELDTAELEACNRLLYGDKAAIEREDGNVSGFNVGVNVGEAAGQTIFHCHIHLIPGASTTSRIPEAACATSSRAGPPTPDHAVCRKLEEGRHSSSRLGQRRRNAGLQPSATETVRGTGSVAADKKALDVAFFSSHTSLCGGEREHGRTGRRNRRQGAV